MKWFSHLKVNTKFNLILLVLLVCLFIVEGFLTHRDHRATIQNVALERARNIAMQIIETRNYMSDVLRDEADDNYNLVPNKVATGAAERLTAAGPHYVRQVSLRYRNPENRPDDYEAGELERFAANGMIAESYQEAISGEDRILRYMRAQVAEKSCLKCHGSYEEAPRFVQQMFPPGHPSYNYQVGEVIGALSVIVPVSGLYQEFGINLWRELLYNLGTLFIVFVVMGILTRRVIINPIRLVSATMSRVTRTGNLTERIPATASRDEIGELIIDFNEMMNELEGAHLHRKESEIRYRNLVEALPAAMVTFLADGKVVISNRRAERLLGMPREKLLGATIFDFLQDGQALQQKIADYVQYDKWDEAGESWHSRIRNVKGELVDVEIALTLASSIDKSPLFTALLLITEK